MKRALVGLALSAAAGCGTVTTTTESVTTLTVETWNPEVVPTEPGPETETLTVYGRDPSVVTRFDDATIARAGDTLRITRRGVLLAEVPVADAGIVRGSRLLRKTEVREEGDGAALAWGFSGAAMIAATILLVVGAAAPH